MCRLGSHGIRSEQEAKNCNASPYAVNMRNWAIYDHQVWACAPWSEAGRNGAGQRSVGGANHKDGMQYN